MPFCILADKIPKECNDFQFNKFTDEKEALELILSYFCQMLPKIMCEYLDYDNKPILVTKENIDVIPPKDYPDYAAMIRLVSDDSEYSDDFSVKYCNYVFELLIETRDFRPDACYENLIKFKSGVETLLINFEKFFGEMIVDIKNFIYFDSTREESKKVVQGGVYRFSLEEEKYLN